MTFMPNLTPEEAAKIHAASLEVLERTGVKVEHQEATALLLKAGATKDDEGRILIPPPMVEEALEKARASSGQIQLFTRDGQPSILLGNGESYFGPGSDALEIRDFETGELRTATLEDVAINVTIADALDFTQGAKSRLEEQYERERRGWDLFYEVLDAVEAALEDKDDFAVALRRRAGELVAACRLADEE